MHQLRRFTSFLFTIYAALVFIGFLLLIFIPVVIASFFWQDQGGQFYIQAMPLLGRFLFTDDRHTATQPL